VKLSVVKGAPAVAREVELRLAGLEGIEDVTANPTTGSVLLFYDTERTGVGEITETLRRWGYLGDLDPVPPRQGSFAGGLGSLVLRATTEAALQSLITALI